FESGTENAPGIFALAARLGEIEALGPEAIATRILMLRDRQEAGLHAGGWQITSPGGDAERSGILTARHETIATEEAIDRLSAAGIRASARGGALRLSPHVANTEAEIDRALNVLA
ncbi:MAG: aminotransferase class V-fold PLP-dependent enzyme, partial [Pseudomonadota bacterium]